MYKIKFRAYNTTTKRMDSFNKLLDLNLNNILLNPESCGYKRLDLLVGYDCYDNEVYVGDILYYVPLNSDVNNKVVSIKNNRVVGQFVRNGNYKQLDHWELEYSKVIGNIYENPEFLSNYIDDVELFNIKIV